MEEKPKRLKRLQLNLNLERIFKVYMSGQLQKPAFTTATGLDQPAYHKFEEFLRNQTMQKTIVLPWFTGDHSIDPIEHEVCQFSMILDTSWKIEGSDSTRDLRVYFRPGCKISAAKTLINRAQNIRKIQICANGVVVLLWTTLDKHLGSHWETPKEIVLESFWTDCILPGFSSMLKQPENVLSLTILGTRNTSDLQADMYKEEVLPVDRFASVKWINGNTELHKFR